MKSKTFTQASPGAPRLLLSFVDGSINALDLLPPALVNYVESLTLSSSSIQILNFASESVLNAALQYLTAEGELPASRLYRRLH